MSRIYFAHPYTRWNSHEANRIERILESRGFTIVNAFNQKELALIDKHGGEYYDNPSRAFAEEIVHGDLELLGSCDEYLGWFPDGCACIGSAIELHHAHVLGKPITVICSHPHPFLHVLATTFHESIDDLERGVTTRLP